MIPYERQQKILSILEQDDMIKIEELHKYFPDISVSTLRRDLKELEKNRKIEPLSCGAIKKFSTLDEIPISTRSELESEKKEKIAEAAADLVYDGDTIYLDSGSTCTMILNKLLNKKIIIYTTNTNVFSINTEVAAEIIILGGKFNPINSSLTGSLTEDSLKDLFFNKSFVGANGIDEVFGVTTPTMEEAKKKKLVKEHSDQIYLVCDSSKFHKLSHVKAFELKDVMIISDEQDKKINELVPIIT